MHHKVAAQDSILCYTPLRLSKHTKKVSLGMHTVGDNLIKTLNFEFRANISPCHNGVRSCKSIIILD